MILQGEDLLTRLDVKDLRRAVAAGGNVLAVMAESHAADDTLVGERVDQVDVKNALNLGVEDGVPVIASLLVVRSNRINLEITKRVSHGRRAWAEAVVGRRVADLRRSISRIRRRGVDLRSGRTNGVRGSADTATSSRTWRSGGLRRLRANAVWGRRTLGVALLVRRLLGVGMRRAWETRRALTHLMLRAHLLLRRPMLLRRS